MGTILGGDIEIIRKEFKMKVYPQEHNEYYRRHNELWPDMKKMLIEHGIIQYNIFLDEETSILFAYLELSENNSWDKIANTEINKRWWDFMAPIMETNSDNSPIIKELKHIFYINNKEII